MNDHVHKIRRTLSHIGIESIITAVIVVIITVILAVFIGNSFYSSEKKVLTQQSELNAINSAMEYNLNLHTHINIVTIAGYAVDTMIATGKSNKKIKEYMTDQTNYIIATLNPDTTGVYGWINGEYLDGAGWVPDDDYVPTERPWYIQTVNSDQKITFVEPYVDAQTNTMMITVSELLSDGESVIAMDVSLDPIQQIIEKISSSTEGSLAFIIDKNGTVVAHSDRSQLGMNYMSVSDNFYGTIAQNIIVNGQMQFDLSTDNNNFSIYVNELEGDWYSVSVINADIWYQPLERTIIIFSLILALIVGFLVFVFLRLNAKNQALRHLITRLDQEEKKGRKLQKLSETDRMTGLYDRANGEYKINELFNYSVEGMFLVIDIDNFKAFNDTYGHQAGDSVIMAVVDVLRKSFRSSDILIRLGGDEFGVFAISLINQEFGERIINSVFERLESCDIPELNGQKIYVSVGAAICTKHNFHSFKELYSIADAAMYTSKKSEKNSLTFSLS